jgi:very-short-patch-repair endonuclease
MLPGVNVSTGPAQPAFRGHRRLIAWRRMSYGLYVEDRKPATLANQLSAWSLVLPTPAAFTHLTAAELRGWWLPHPIPHPIFAALREGDPCPHRRGLFVSRHPSRVPSELLSGIRLTTAAETLLAAARDLGVLDLVLMGDSALRLGHCTLEELVETAAQRRCGAPMLRRVIGMLDSRSESPWESIMRVLHRAADIPVEPQHVVLDQWGRFVARGDLWIVGTNRLHEFDGGVHREPDTQSRDLARDRLLIEAGWQRFGFTKTQVRNEGASIIASTDTLLGRTWDPARLRRWNALIADSMFGPPGRARALRNWRTTR